MNPYATSLVDELDELLPAGPALENGGSLLIMVGLPGAGKSYLVRHLRRLLSCSLVSTDQVRQFMRNRPTYTAAEMVYNYEICFTITDQRLRRGQRVIFDGSNYLAERRHRLREIARRHQVPFAVAYVQASTEVTRNRLLHRRRSGTNNKDLSDAGWSVYRWMVEAQEPVAGPHLILDTSNTPIEELAFQLYQYWMESEQIVAPANDYL